MSTFEVEGELYARMCDTDTENPVMAGEVVGITPVFDKDGAIAPVGVVGVVLGKDEDKAMHAETANRSRTPTRPGMGPAHEPGHEPIKGKCKAGVNPLYKDASPRSLFLEVRRRGLRTPGNLEKFDVAFYTQRKGGIKGLKKECASILNRSDQGTLRPADMPGAAEASGSGMEYIPQSTWLCVGFWMILGGAYSFWGVHVHETQGTLQSLFIGLTCLFLPPLCVGGKLCSERTVEATTKT